MSNNLPIPSGPEVYFEKWVNPYSTDFSEMPGYEYLQNKFLQEEPEYEDGYKDKDPMLDGDQGDEAEEEVKNMFAAIKTLFTPMGPIPLTEYSMPSKLFKFWVGHSNFNITPSLQAVIENVPGVETVNVWTRYRFRIGIGKLFDDKMVMFEVKENMIKNIKK